MSPFFATLSMWCGLRHARERELCLEPPPCTMAPPRLAKRSLSGGARMNGMGLLQEATTKNELAESISTESIFACEARFFLGEFVVHSQYKFGTGTDQLAPLHARQAQMRHNETRERPKSTNTEWVLTEPLTDHSYSLEDERPLPAFALTPTLHRQLLLLISRTDSF